MISHDWPTGVTNYGDQGALLKQKPYFREDIAKNELGNPFLMNLLKVFRPQYWFSGHLHCRFQATIPHDSPEQSPPIQINPDEITIDDEEDEKEDMQEGGVETSEKCQMDMDEEKKRAITLFLALDKDKTPQKTDQIKDDNHKDLAFIDIELSEFTDIPIPKEPSTNDNETFQLWYDPEWLSIVKAAHPYLSLNKNMFRQAIPTGEAMLEKVNEMQSWIRAHIHEFEILPMTLEAIQQGVPAATSPQWKELDELSRFRYSIFYFCDGNY